MKNRFFNIISANIETDNHLLLRKVVINNVFLMVATITLSLAAILNIFVFKNYELAVIDIISALTTLYAVYKLKKTKNIKIAQMISSINILLFFTIFVYLTHNDDFSLIWTIFAPIFLIPILGHKKGLIAVILFYTPFFILAFINIGIWQDGNWSAHAFARLVLSSLLLVYVTYINEMTLFRANKMLKEKEIKEQENIQQLINSRDRAIEAEKSKDVFLANMSHEIRTPLNAIVGFVEILKREVDDAEHKKYLSIIDTSSNSLLSLIGDILDFAKLRNGKLEILKKPYDLKKELDIIFHLFDQNAKEKSILYSVNFKNDFNKFIVFDKIRVNQIVSNFLSNAMKFTTTNGTIDVQIEIENENLVISVKDSGIGMTQEQQGRIFKEFEQAQRDTTNKYGGTGLGLAISLKLAHLMDGDIFVESEVNSGTLFTLFLPVKSTDKEILTRVDEREGNDLETDSLSGTILVAEDNKSNQMLIKLLLQEMDIDVEMANNGEEALSLYKKSCSSDKKYDLILMDNNMPIMGGVEATQKIKKLLDYYATPIVALTANALKGDREYFLKNGMDDYLKKPLELDELTKVLKQFLRTEK